MKKYDAIVIGAGHNGITNGAYLAKATLSLAAGASKRWHVVADVNYDSAAIAQLSQFLNQPDDQIELLQPGQCLV